MEAPESTGVSAELRAELARRARDRKSRFVEFDSEEPTVWNPTQVLHPECGIPFTDITAWHYIAEQLDKGCDVTQVCLRKPAGHIGYELDLEGAAGHPRIHVKVRLYKDKIKGRSFHNSTRAGV
jgi:hypothetical protein